MQPLHAIPPPTMHSTPWSYTAADQSNASKLADRMPTHATRCPQGSSCALVASGQCPYQHARREKPCMNGLSCWKKQCAFWHPPGWQHAAINMRYKVNEWLSKVGKPCPWGTRCTNENCASSHDPSWNLYASNQEFKEAVHAALQKGPVSTGDTSHVFGSMI